MKQTYITLTFLIVVAITGSATCVYFSIGYNEISSNSKQVIIKDMIDAEEDISKLKKMAHHMHVSYTTALKEHSQTYASFAKILTAISVLCGLSLFAIYKYNISNKAFNSDAGKDPRPLT